MDGILQKFIVALTLVQCALAQDQQYTGLDAVSDDSRYTALHPGVPLKTFDKAVYRRGLTLFSSGKRISGDRLLLNFYDSIELTSVADLEAILTYPSIHKWHHIITRVEIYAVVPPQYANVHFIDGGIRKSYGQILFTFNKTSSAEFEIFIYGY